MDMTRILVMTLYYLAAFMFMQYLMTKKKPGLPDILTSLMGAFLFAFGYNYFFPATPAKKPEAALVKPLHTAINLTGQTTVSTPTLTDIETPGALYTFSSQGAILTKLSIKRTTDKNTELLTTINQTQQDTINMGCFLVALDGETPLHFTFEGKEVADGKLYLTYRGENESVTVLKRYTVFEATYQIDLQLTIEPKPGTAAASLGTIRLLMPSSAMNDSIAGIEQAASGSLQKTYRTKLSGDERWLKPTLFGSDSRYCIHAMVRDDNQFCQRGYYIVPTAQKALISVIEGPEVQDKTTWSLSFYLGPKDSTAISSVDDRLIKTLDYSGFWGPLAYFFLMILQWLHSFLHNYGLAIIALSIFVKLALLPFSGSTDNSASKKKQQDLQRKLAHLEQRYKDNPEFLRQEKAALIAKHGLPGLSGCIGIMLQLPIMFILSRTLSSSIELYKAPFLWIKDLSMPDPWYILPFFSTIFTLFMMLQSKGSVQQKLPAVAISCVIGVFSTTFSAGLTLFFSVSSFLSFVQTLIQQYFARR